MAHEIHPVKFLFITLRRGAKLHGAHDARRDLVTSVGRRGWIIILIACNFSFKSEQHHAFREKTRGCAVHANASH